MTYFPPIKKGQGRNNSSNPYESKTLPSKRDNSERTIFEKTK